MIEKDVILDILRRIQALINRDKVYYAKEYIRLEI